MNRRTPLCTAVIAAAAAVLVGCGSAGRSPAPYPSPPPRAARLHPPFADARYRIAVEAGIAARLHTSVASLRSQLQATPGSTLETLAKPLGLAEDQLGALTLASLNQAAETAVRSGRWTPADARKEKHYWSRQPAPSLVAEVSAWLASL